MISPRQQVVNALRQQMRTWSQANESAKETISTGCGLDRLLPAGGLQRGDLVEWMATGPTSGAGTLALLVARQIQAAMASRCSGMLLIDPEQQLFPAGLLALGFDLSTLLLVRPGSTRDTLWTWEQALRCSELAVVWGTLPDRLSSQEFRRLQLAAESSGSIGFLLRTERALSQSSWARARLVVHPRASGRASPRFDVEVPYSRGRLTRERVSLELNRRNGLLHDVISTHETHSLPVVSKLVDAAAG